MIFFLKLVFLGLLDENIFVVLRAEVKILDSIDF